MTRARTKEEILILALYDLSEEQGQEVSLDLLKEETGFQEKKLKLICRDLAQANFIKKIDSTHIRLTPNGRALVQQLMEE